MAKTKYSLLHRNKFLTINASNIDDFISIFEEQLEIFRQMKFDGVTLDPTSSISDDYAVFETMDSLVAEKYGFANEE